MYIKCFPLTYLINGLKYAILNLLHGKFWFWILAKLHEHCNFGP